MAAGLRRWADIVRITDEYEMGQKTKVAQVPIFSLYRGLHPFARHLEELSVACQVVRFW
jgi:hypothetical protein